MGAVCLFQKSNFTIADLGYPANWIVPASAGSSSYAGVVTQSGTPSALPVWDLTRFQEVHFYMRAGVYTHTGVTFFGPRVYGYDGPVHPGDYLASLSTDGQHIPAGGAASTIILTNRIPYVAAAVANNNLVTIGALPLYGQFDFFFNGTMNTIASLRVAIYGIER